MAIGEHYFIKMFGLALAQDVLNTFAYRQVSGVGANAAQDLAFEFDTTVMAPFTNCIGTYTSMPRLETFAVETPTDYDDRTPINNVGTRVISSTGRPPSFTAFGFRSNRAGAGSRASYKRFVGMAEDDSDGNGLTSVFQALVLGTGLQLALAATLVAASGNQFVPIQLKSGWLIGFPPVENFVISSWTIPYLTSQVSRRL